MLRNSLIISDSESNGKNSVICFKDLLYFNEISHPSWLSNKNGKWIFDNNIFSCQCQEILSFFHFSIHLLLCLEILGNVVSNNDRHCCVIIKSSKQSKWPPGLFAAHNPVLKVIKQIITQFELHHAQVSQASIWFNLHLPSRILC